MSGVSGVEWRALRERFLADQGEGAVAEAADLLARAAQEDGRVVSRDGAPSGWALQLLREARRNRCPHARRDGVTVLFVPAHRRQLLCRGCARRARELLVASADAARCDLCREVLPLERFMLQAGCVLVTGRCCEACRPTVYGASAPGGS